MTVTDSDLTEEQKSAIGRMARWYPAAARGEGPRVFKLQGPAGTGKSELLRFALGEIGLDEEDVCPVGPTGMSAQVMRRKGIRRAGTIHGAIYTPAKDVGEAIDEMRKRIAELRGELRPAGKGGDAPDAALRKALLEEIERAEADIRELRRQEKDELEWIVNPHGKAAVSRLIVCDEASMVGGRLMEDLESFGVPVIYVGDSFQLDSLNDGESVFYSKDKRLLPVDAELAQIHRQAEGSAIIRYSRDIRLGTNDAGLTFFGRDRSDDGGMLLRVPPGKLAVEHLAQANQVICGYNKTRHATNRAIRDFLGRGDSPMPVPGDKLVCLRNHKDYGIVNGTLAAAESAHQDFNGSNGSFAADLSLDDGRELTVRMLAAYFLAPGDQGELDRVPFWARKRFAHFDFGNTLTCHKAQGTQHHRGVVVEEPFGKSPTERRRWRYTAATRFEKYLIVEAPGGR